MKQSDKISHLRKEYRLTDLNEKELESNPFLQFEKWILHAMDAEITEPNAMTLATVGKDGMPSARIVLLKDYSSEGFCFFSNYQSKKGKQLAENPQNHPGRL